MIAWARRAAAGLRLAGQLPSAAGSGRAVQANVASLHTSETTLAKKARTAAPDKRAVVPELQPAFRKAPSKAKKDISAGPYTPVKGTVMEVNSEYWEVQLVNGKKGQLRRQHMIRRAQEGEQLTFYMLGTSPLGIAGMYHKKLETSIRTRQNPQIYH